MVFRAIMCKGFIAFYPWVRSLKSTFDRNLQKWCLDISACLGLKWRSHFYS